MDSHGSQMVISLKGPITTADKTMQKDNFERF